MPSKPLYRTNKTLCLHLTLTIFVKPSPLDSVTALANQTRIRSLSKDIFVPVYGGVFSPTSFPLPMSSSVEGVGDATENIPS